MEEFGLGTEILGLGEIKLLLEAVRKMERREVDDLEAMLVAAIFYFFFFCFCKYR